MVGLAWPLYQKGVPAAMKQGDMLIDRQLACPGTAGYVGSCRAAAQHHLGSGKLAVHGRASTHACSKSKQGLNNKKKE